MVYSGIHLGKNGIGKELTPINTDLFANMISFSVFAYEGVGVVLPILDITEDPKKYPRILFFSITSVFMIYIIFGLMTYFSYGKELLISPIITSNLPEG